MKNRQIAILVLFAIAIIVFNLTTFRTGFTDSAEYINVAKSIAGFSNTNVFVMHSIVYSLYLSIFLFFIKSLLVIKLANAIWLILGAILLYNIAGKRSLYIWVFSPIVYYMSIWISPMLPISFLFLLTYYCIKQYEESNKLSYLIISALSTGLIGALREQMLAIVAVFLIIFLYNKPLKTSIYYILFMLPTFAIRLIVDYYYFNNPFYTIITFTGTLFLGGLEGGNFVLSEWFLFPFIIAPLSFLLYKLDSKYKREKIFLVIFVLTTIPLGQLRFFMPIAAFVIFLLAKVLTNKQLLINSLISIVLISTLTYPYFQSNTEEARIISDLNAVKQEINPAIAVVTNGGAYSFPTLATNYWNELGPHYIWSRDLQLYLENNPDYRNIEFSSKPRFNADKIVTISFLASQNRDKLLNDNFFKNELFFILNKKEFKYYSNAKQLAIIWRGELILNDINLVKCYQEICVFRK